MGEGGGSRKRDGQRRKAVLSPLFQNKYILRLQSFHTQSKILNHQWRDSQLWAKRQEGRKSISPREGTAEERNVQFAKHALCSTSKFFK